MLIVPLAFSLPVWVQWILFDVPAGTVVGAGVPLKHAIAIVAVSLYPWLPRATFPMRLVPCDYAMLGLVAVHCLSDFRAAGFSWLPLARSAAEWYFPYMAGRLAIQSLADWRWLWPAVAAVATFLGCTTAFEAFTGVNVFEPIYGLRPLENTPRDAARWGLRRAYGPCLNPIYLGILQLLLLGWSLLAAKQAIDRTASSWWFLAPIASVTGIFCTGSRGPLLGVAIAAAGTCFLSFPQYRVVLLVAVLLTGGIGFAQRERVINLLEQWSGESQSLPNKSVVIGDERQKFSGTRSRLLLLDVYKIAFKRSGLLGYGTEATTGFPLRIPLGPQEAETLRRVRYVDNSYALIMLRFGYLGAFAFSAACILAVCQTIYLAGFYKGDETGAFATFFSATLAGGLATIMTVWLAPDFSFVLIWSLGISSGLLASHSRDEWLG